MALPAQIGMQQGLFTDRGLGFQDTSFPTQYYEIADISNAKTDFDQRNDLSRSTLPNRPTAPDQRKSHSV